MISVKVKIDPGRSILQIPGAGRDEPAGKMVGLAVTFHTFISTYPNTKFFLVDFAIAVAAAAAGAVAGVFRATRLRTKKTDMLNPAVAAALAGKQDFLERVFEKAFKHPRALMIVE